MLKYIIEGYSHYSSNGSTITGIVPKLDTQIVSYDIENVYDSYTRKAPYYWNSNMWSKTSMMNSNYSYRSNPDGQSSTGLFIYNSPANSNHFFRFTLDVAQPINKLGFYVGSPEGRIPHYINVYLVVNSYKEEMITSRTTTGLKLIGTINLTSNDKSVVYKEITEFEGVHAAQFEFNDTFNKTTLEKSIKLNIYKNNNMFKSLGLNTTKELIYDFDDTSTWSYEIDGLGNYDNIPKTVFIPSYSVTKVSISLTPIIEKEVVFTTSTGNDVRGINVELYEGNVLIHAISDISSNAVKLPRLDISKNYSLKVVSSRYKEVSLISIEKNYSNIPVNLIEKTFKHKMILSKDSKLYSINGNKLTEYFFSTSELMKEIGKEKLSNLEETLTSKEYVIKNRQVSIVRKPLSIKFSQKEVE